MIAASLLQDVLVQASSRAGVPDATLAGHLRSAFPGVHFTVCSDDDIPPRLACAAANDFYRLYYVAAGGHCLALTTDAEAATGLVVALRSEDDAT